MNFFKILESKGMHYNSNQKEAITHMDGPLLIVAGPGSGKTSVITARASHLIHQGINPSNIMVITFTRAAANEMKQRFKEFPGITPDHYKKTEFGTFHSTFYKILNTYYGRYLPVLEQSKCYSAIRGILKSLNEPFDDEVIQNTLNDISIIRTSLTSIDDFKPQSISLSKLKSVCSQYESYKQSAKCIDFDDMMIMCKRLLESDDNTLKYYRQKFKYILIDEFQDTNHMQFEIIKLISSPVNNLCVVGDDDQSIYSFRGGMPDCLVNFKSTFQSTKTVILDINYRSTGQIVDFASKVINNNSCRIEKDLKSSRETGSPPSLAFPQNDEMEGKFIADTIEEFKKRGSSYRDFAVLYRTNIQCRHIMDVLIRRDIPFNIKDGLNNFFDHWVCRDIISYLKLCLDNNDIRSFIQIINRPSRYISKDIIESIYSICSEKKYGIFDALDVCDLKEFQRQRIRELLDSIKSIKHMIPVSAVNFIRKLIGYDDYIRKYCMDSNIEFDQIFDILDEFESSSAGFRTIYEFLSHIHEVSIKLKENKQKLNFIKDSITLSTVHGAKGLEFPCVFLIGAVEGFFPHKKSIRTGENIEEERRLFYVAVTRAKDNLYVISPKTYHGKSSSVSRFLTETAADETKSGEKINTEFNPGDLISHRLFGTGKITSIKKGIVEVLFNTKKGLKQLDLKTCVENKLIEKP